MAPECPARGTHRQALWSDKCAPETHAGRPGGGASLDFLNARRRDKNKIAHRRFFGSRRFKFIGMDVDFFFLQTGFLDLICNTLLSKLTLFFTLSAAKTWNLMLLVSRGKECPMSAAVPSSTSRCFSNSSLQACASQCRHLFSSQFPSFLCFVRESTTSQDTPAQ